MEDIFTPQDNIDLFPQKVMIFKYPINLDLLTKQIYYIQSKFPNSIKHYPKELMYQTPPNLLNSSPVFSHLKDFILNIASKNFKSNYALTESWANICYTYSYSKFHDHGNSDLSGVFYLKVPPNSGKLEFYNRYDSPEVTSFETWETSLFLFNGKQPHSTTPNLSKSPKICIAFNLKKVE